MTPLLTQLHTRIAELVPDVKKLSFGCEVKIEDYDGKYGDEYPLEQTVLYVVNGDYGEQDDVFTMQGCLEYDFEIIGHPITLADVLQAMNELDKEKNYNAFGLAVAVNGMFFRDREALCRWDTSKNLDDQSPEVHEFIGKIIL